MPIFVAIRRFGIPLVVAIGGVWAIYYAVVQPKLYDFDQRELSKLQGCFFVDGKQLIRIQGSAMISEGQVRAFRGAHEKNRDVLIVEMPIILRSAPLRLENAGTVTKIPIIYGSRPRLQFWSDEDRAVQAINRPCD